LRPDVTSHSQALGSIEAAGGPGSVQPSQPVTGLTKPFAAPVLQARPMLARLLTVREVAERLAVSPATVHRLCAGGRLRFVRVGAVVRIDSASLETFLATGS